MRESFVTHWVSGRMFEAIKDWANPLDGSSDNPNARDREHPRVENVRDLFVIGCMHSNHSKNDTEIQGANENCETWALGGISFSFFLLPRKISTKKELAG